MRGCYWLADLQNVAYYPINDTAGCHSYHIYSHSPPYLNHTALFCFCDTDYCNAGSQVKVRFKVTSIWDLWSLITVMAAAFGVL